MPSTSHTALHTTALFVQGYLTIDPSSGLDGLKVLVYGVEDVMFVPHEDNLVRCAYGECNVSSKGVVVSWMDFLSVLFIICHLLFY